MLSVVGRYPVGVIRKVTKTCTVLLSVGHYSHKTRCLKVLFYTAGVTSVAETLMEVPPLKFKRWHLGI